ncbi:hypothetical protein [Falsiroseomonas sp. E2-1-a4]|uniref:hypothetical protein n=1 Tax=Falsiroseomonas sp. E2-1-a4 TaxID=3239299 RepID=UPI003F3402D1
MPDKQFPWEYHPDLTAERLTIVGSLIADGRERAVELFDEAAGDSNWTLGTRAFEFGRKRIIWAAESGSHPWLNVIDPSLQLIFLVGQIPIRIYKGDAEDPTPRTLRQPYSELRQLSLLFPGHDEGGDLAYRFAVETDFDGSVLAVKFVGLRNETAILNWQVPIDRETIALGSLGRPATEAVELAPPTVEVRRAAARKKGT